MRTPCDACYVQAIPTDEEMEKLSKKWRPYRSLGGPPDTPGAINGIEPECDLYIQAMDCCSALLSTASYENGSIVNIASLSGPWGQSS